MINEITRFVTETAYWASQTIQQIPVAGDAYNFVGAYAVSPLWDAGSYAINTYAAPFFKDHVSPLISRHSYVVGGAAIVVGLFVIRASVNEYQRRHP